MESLPNELHVMIFQFLPIATLMIGRLVSTGWKCNIDYLIKQKELPTDSESIIASLVSINDMKIIPLIIHKDKIFRNKICQYASMYGHINILQWAEVNECPLNHKCLENAVRHERFETIKWLFDKYPPKATFCHIAAESGNLTILKWLKSKGQKLITAVCREAAKNKHIEILKWARENDCPWSSDTIEQLIATKNFKILKWAINEGCPVENYVCNHAIRADFEILKWLYQNGYPLTKYSCEIASRINNFEILKWLREKECPWDTSVTFYAAKNKNFEMLKWAVENGCSWHENTGAFLEKNQKMFQWAIDHHCPIWHCDINSWLFDHDLEDIEKWAKKNSIKWNFQLERKNTADSYYSVLKWAYDLGYRPKKICIKIYKSIINEKHYVFLNWLISLGLRNKKICDYVAELEDFEMLDYLMKHGFECNKTTRIIYRLYIELMETKKQISLKS